MSDFVRGNCHKCKYEITAECVPRSQKMGYPKCYQSIVTNADHIRAMTDEELADWLGVYCNGQTAQEVGKPCVSDMGSCEECWLDWLKQPVEEKAR